MEASSTEEAAGGSSINAATRRGIIQKVMARAAGNRTGTLLLSPVKPGQIIKIEGQSIVGKSNNNAIGQSSAGQTEDEEADGDENGFKITPDYIQESEYTWEGERVLWVY